MGCWSVLRPSQTIFTKSLFDLLLPRYRQWMYRSILLHVCMELKYRVLYFCSRDLIA